MKCQLCPSKDDMTLEYAGPVRNGAWPNKIEGRIFACYDCGVRKLDPVLALPEEAYVEPTYREMLNEPSNAFGFNQVHDKEQLFRLDLTGTEIFRRKIVCDVGAGGGSFLDHIFGLAKRTFAVEPSSQMREGLEEACHIVYKSTGEIYDKSFDIVTSFAVLEHVKDPLFHLEELFRILVPGGTLFLTTPNHDQFLMQCHPLFPQFFYRTQHDWYFNSSSLRRLLNRVGFAFPEISTPQARGLDSILGWFAYNRPNTKISLTYQLNSEWRYAMEYLHCSGEHLFVRVTKP